MVTRVAPASIAFSTSSLTIEAGRSTTSPAAIWLARSAGSRLILPTLHPAAAARESRGGGEDAGQAVIERERFVRQANQLVADVAKPERHLRADVDDLAADEPIERFALSVDALHQHEHVAARVQDFGDELGVRFFDEALFERIDPRGQLLERRSQASGS